MKTKSYDFFVGEIKTLTERLQQENFDGLSRISREYARLKIVYVSQILDGRFSQNQRRTLESSLRLASEALADYSRYKFSQELKR